MNWLVTGGVTGFLAVALGAFGAHGLRERLPPRMLEIWQTAVLYHLVHAVVLVALALHAQASGRPPGPAAPLFLAGIVIFSGSLYALAATGVTRLGAITPLGGLALLAGWTMIAVRGLR